MPVKLLTNSSRRFIKSGLGCLLQKSLIVQRVSDLASEIVSPTMSAKVASTRLNQLELAWALLHLP